MNVCTKKQCKPAGRTDKQTRVSLLARLGLRSLNASVVRKISAAQKQTKDTFSYKWSKKKTYESQTVRESNRKWLFKRYCGGHRRQLSEWLKGDSKVILDVGCGAGFSAMLFFGRHLRRHDYLGVDLSDAVKTARECFKKAGTPGDFLQMNFLDLPLPDRSVDIIFAEGVLHHTDSTEGSIKFLARKLKKRGLFLFYVYRKKALIREFTDDAIRGYLRKFKEDRAWEALRPLTKLGAALGKLNHKLIVPEAIPILGIRKGPIGIQRFFYWYVCKAFYRPGYTVEEMNHVNFDWFRPLNCHRHSPEEIKKWCRQSGLVLKRLYLEESGISVVAVKK